MSHGLSNQTTTSINAFAKQQIPRRVKTIYRWDQDIIQEEYATMPADHYLFNALGQIIDMKEQKTRRTSTWVYVGKQQERAPTSRFIGEDETDEPTGSFTDPLHVRHRQSPSVHP